MSEILSSEEIDNLLTAISSGEVDTEEVNQNQLKIKIYDFSRPDKFSRDEIRKISIIHEGFARCATTELSSLLQSCCHIHVASVDQLTFEEFIRSIPNPTTLALLDMAPISGQAVFEIDPSVSFAIVDKLCGGKGDGIIKIQRELTEIETAVMERVVNVMTKNLNNAWSEILHFTPERIENNPQFAQIISPNSMVLLITLEAKIGDVEGMINFCIPAGFIDYVRDLHSFSPDIHENEKSGRRKNINNIEIPVDYSLNTEAILLTELLKLKKGQLIDIQNCNFSLQTGSTRIFETPVLWEGNRVEINFPKLVPFMNKDKSEKLKGKQVKTGSEKQAGLVTADIVRKKIESDKSAFIKLIKYWINQYEDKKLAAFFITFPEEISAPVIAELDDEKIQLLYRLTDNVQKITIQEKNEMLKSINNLLFESNTPLIGSVKESLIYSLGVEKVTEIVNAEQEHYFNYLDKDNIETFIKLICGEHPQTIAMVLSRIHSMSGSYILNNMPHEIQSEVAKRIAVSGAVSNEIIRDVDKIIKKKMDVTPQDNKSYGGINKIVDMLNLSDRSTERTVLETMEEEDPYLVEEIKKRMFVFEDIVLLGDKDIQKVLRELDSTELAKSLKGVSSEVQDKIFRNMSKRAAAVLKEDMDFMGPVRLNDVEQSQQKIVNIIRKLEESGDIVIARAGVDELLE